MTAQLYSAVASALLTLWSADRVRAQEAAPAESDVVGSRFENPEYVLAGFRAGRDRLSRGCFSATKVGSMSFANDGMRSEETEYRCAFDYAQQLLRFDFNVAMGTSISGKYISRSEYALMASADDHLVTRYPSGVYPNDISKKPFDVRNVGVVDFLLLFAKTFSFEEFMSAIERQHGEGLVTCAAVHDGDQHLVLLKYIRTSDRSERWDIFMDPERDFVPVRWERRWADASGELSDPNGTMSTEWSQIQDVWVPLNVQYSSETPGNPNLALAFVWESVNGDLDPVLFSQEGLDLPDSAWIVDRRTGTSIIEGRIADATRRAESPHAPAGTFYRRTWVLVTINVAVFSTLILLWIVRRRRTPH